jgi:tRNA threonylcarbamoyladenosine biosynthesis protein TsaE
MTNTFFAQDELAMEQFGSALLTAVENQGVVYLLGDLGMGKTTLSRGVIRAAGHQGNVKSPTYTLVEPYETPSGLIYHFDLYRLVDPEELEYLGIRDYFTEDTLCLIEWPDKGEGLIPRADIEVSIQLEGSGRQLTWKANTIKGGLAADMLSKLLEVSK